MASRLMCVLTTSWSRSLQMFSYPFSRSGNETEDGTHFPKLADLQYLCELAGMRLKVRRRHRQ